MGLQPIADGRQGDFFFFQFPFGQKYAANGRVRPPISTGIGDAR